MTNSFIGRQNLCLLIVCMFSTCTPGLAQNSVETILGNGQEGNAPVEGDAKSVAISQPFGISTGPDRALYVCEVGSHVIRRVDLTTGHTKVVVGSGRKGYSGDGKSSLQAELNEPYEVRFDSHGNMLFVEMQNHLVRKVDAQSGIITTVAGIGKPGDSGDNGPATAAQLNQPHSIVLDTQDNIYICDIRNHRIRRVDAATGVISTIAGTGRGGKTPDGSPVAGTPLNGPRALEFDGRTTMYLALREGNALFRFELENGHLKHLAGTGKSGYSGDGGPAKAAQLAGPKGVALAANGDLYFADTESHTVRVYRPTADTIETVIGDGQSGDGPDGPPLKCRLNRPHGVFVSADGWLYVGDSNNHRVRRMKIAQ